MARIYIEIANVDYHSQVARDIEEAETLEVTEPRYALAPNGTQVDPHVFDEEMDDNG